MGLHWVQIERDFIDGAGPCSIGAELGISDDEALGKCTRVWAWSLTHAAPAGVVRGAGASRAIERAAGWTGPEAAFVQALMHAEVIEKTVDGIRFRGWVDRYGKVLEEQEKDRKRKDVRRKSAGSSDGIPPGSPGGRPDGSPDGVPPESPTESFSREDLDLDFRIKTLETTPEIETVKPSRAKKRERGITQHSLPEEISAPGWNELIAKLFAVFRANRGSDPIPRPRDWKALKTLRERVKANDAEIVLRWERGLGAQFKARVDNFVDLNEKWDALARTDPPGEVRDIRRGVAHAEDFEGQHGPAGILKAGEF